MTKTALVTKVLLAITALVLLVVTVLATADGQPAHLGEDWFSGGPFGLLQAAGLLFFAFAGYARIATLGEEVRNPSRTIPRAIITALAVTVVIYLLVGTAVLLALGPARLATSTAPLADALGGHGLGIVARIGAAAASLGALLGLIAGVGRTGLAMARNRDLPAVLAHVHPRHQVPDHAEIAVALVVCVLVSTVDLRGAIGFSSFGVLVYYAIANAAAYTQPPTVRRWPRWLNIAGGACCLVLAATLPWQSVLAGLAVFAIGLAGRFLVLRQRSRAS